MCVCVCVYVEEFVLGWRMDGMRACMCMMVCVRVYDGMCVCMCMMVCFVRLWKRSLQWDGT